MSETPEPLSWFVTVMFPAGHVVEQVTHEVAMLDLVPAAIRDAQNKAHGTPIQSVRMEQRTASVTVTKGPRYTVRRHLAGGWGVFDNMGGYYVALYVATALEAGVLCKQYEEMSTALQASP